MALWYANLNQEKHINVYEEWVENFREQVDVVYLRMKAVDEQNLFEKDDDVGFVFSELLRISKEFSDSIK